MVDVRRDIFGLGFAQLAVTALVLGGLSASAGFPLKGAVATGLALALSATAIGLQLLEERGDLQVPYGRKSFAILLFQDLSIVPILALLPLLAVTGGSELRPSIPSSRLQRRSQPSRPVVLIRRHGSPPTRVLANSGAREEVMIASALLVVLGAALLLQEVQALHGDGRLPRRRSPRRIELPPSAGGRYRAVPRDSSRPLLHVGGHVDRPVPRAPEWLALLAAVPIVLAAKIVIIAILVRIFDGSLRDGIRAGTVLAPAGEFSFVLLPLATSLNLVLSIRASS